MELFTGFDENSNYLSANDSSFETDVSGWDFNTAFGTFNTGVKSQSTTLAYPGAGTKSLKASWAAGTKSGWIMKALTGLVPGATYTARAKVYVPAGSPDVKIGDVFVTMGAASAVKDDWSEITVTWTQGSGTTFNLGVQSVQVGAGDCFIDSVMVTSPEALIDLWTAELSSPNNYLLSTSLEKFSRYRGLRLKTDSAKIEKPSVNQAGVETSIADWYTGNNFGFSTPARSLAQSAVRAHSGTKSLLVTWETMGGSPASSEFAGTTISGLIKGRQYNAKVWVYVPAGSPDPYLTATGIIFGNGPSTATKDAWVQISTAWRAEGTTQNLAVAVNPAVGTAGGTQMWIDDLTVSEDQPGPTARSASIPTRGGVATTFKIWAKATGTNPRLAIMILSNDDTNDPGYAVSGVTRTEATFTPTGVWTEYTVTHTPGATHTRVRLEVRAYSNTSGTCDVYVDKATLIGGERAVLTMLDVYPVGAIYTSVVSTSPATLFGGTWAAFAAGRVLVGRDAGQAEFDTVEETGGEKTHVLTTAEMPAHAHSLTGVNPAAGVTGEFGRYPAAIQNDAHPNWGVSEMANTGGGGAHNNLQPYIVVYMWKRTA
jgi:hypothetical protein